MSLPLEESKNTLEREIILTNSIYNNSFLFRCESLSADVNVMDGVWNHVKLVFNRLLWQISILLR